MSEIDPSPRPIILVVADTDTEKAFLANAKKEAQLEWRTNHGGKISKGRGRPTDESELTKAAKKLIAAAVRQRKHRPTVAELTKKLMALQGTETYHFEDESTAGRAARLALIHAKKPSEITTQDRAFLADRRSGEYKFLQSLEADAEENWRASQLAQQSAATISAITQAIAKVLGRQLTLDEHGNVAKVLALLI